MSRGERVDWVAGNQLLIDDAGKVLKCSVGNGWHDWLSRHAWPKKRRFDNLKIALSGIELSSQLNKIALKNLIFTGKSWDLEASAQFPENLVDWLWAEMVHYAPTI